MHAGHKECLMEICQQHTRNFLICILETVDLKMKKVMDHPLIVREC